MASLHSGGGVSSGEREGSRGGGSLDVWMVSREQGSQTRRDQTSQSKFMAPVRPCLGSRPLTLSARSHFPPLHPSITGGLASHVYSESSEHAGNSEKSFVSWFVRAYVDLKQFAPCVSSAGPTCAAPASTRTAVRAGRPCPGATSASSVSALQLSLAFSTSIHSKQIQTYKIPLLLSSNLQEFVRRWLLLQTQHVHVFQWAALPQLWIGSRSVTP